MPDCLLAADNFFSIAYMLLYSWVLDPLDSRRESNASNDRANGALRPVSNTQQMPPPIHTLALSVV